MPRARSTSRSVTTTSSIALPRNSPATCSIFCASAGVVRSARAAISAFTSPSTCALTDSCCTSRRASSAASLLSCILVLQSQESPRTGSAVSHSSSLVHCFFDSDNHCSKAGAQAVRLHHSVALATGRLQPVSVEDGHTPARVANHILPLETAGGPRDHGAGHAEHRRHKLVLHLELVPRRVVVRHQQPARESLVHLVRADAGRRLSDLREERV